MTDPLASPTPDELVGALDALDVPFLMGGIQNERALTLSPAELFSGLAASTEARVRSAIIPLLLRHPEYAEQARPAAAHLPDPSRYTLELFYTAAMLLQQKYSARLTPLFGVQPLIPDLFSKKLNLELSKDINISLARVGERNAELRGLKLNWVGTYEHAALTWLKYVELYPTHRESKWLAA